MPGPTGGPAKRHIKALYSPENTFCFHSNIYSCSWRGNAMACCEMNVVFVCFWRLTVHCDVLRGFHCWVIGERASVFAGGVTGDTGDGVWVCVFHFHHLILERQTVKTQASDEFMKPWRGKAAKTHFDTERCNKQREFLMTLMKYWWVLCTLRKKLKLVGAGLPSATHFRVTLSPSTRGSWAMTWRAMFSVESVQKQKGAKSQRGRVY